MHNPVVGDSYLKKKSRQFVNLCEAWWFSNLIRPIFFLLPPMLASAVATRQGLSEQVVSVFGQNVGDMLNGSAVIVIIVAFLYVALMKAAFSGIKQYSKPDRELGTNDCLAIISAINLVVGDKSKRFSSHLKSQMAAQAINPGKTFLEITRPDQQIALLIVGLRTVFEYIDSTNALFRVGLLRISGGAPLEWVAFEPASHPPRTPPSQLSAPSSSVSCALKTKAIVVVEDIQAELSRKTNKQDRRYIRGNTQDRDQGSQLCFPISHASTGNVEYVITVAGNKKGCLIEGYAELYSWIIENFATRISLEHSLLALKEKANVQQAA